MDPDTLMGIEFGLKYFFFVFLPGFIAYRCREKIGEGTNFLLKQIGEGIRLFIILIFCVVFMTSEILREAFN